MSTKKRGPGRPRIGKRPLSAAEAQARRAAKKAASGYVRLAVWIPREIRDRLHDLVGDDETLETTIARLVDQEFKRP